MFLLRSMLVAELGKQTLLSILDVKVRVCDEGMFNRVEKEETTMGEYLSSRF